MDSCKTRGIVTRRADYGESNCMLTIMTEDFGLISAGAYGVKSRKSRIASSARLFTFSELVLKKKPGDVYRVESAEVIDGFYPVCEDVVKLSLANYICDAAREAFSDGDIHVLRLVLNTLYAIAYRDIKAVLAKAVFELKLMQYSGYEPDLSGCIRCGKPGFAAFDFNGGIVCAECADAAAMKLSGGLYNALKFIFSAEDKKIFAFSVSDEVMEELSLLAESYFLAKSEKTYKSLDYYKKIL